jgi:hypothetical protein
MGETICMAVYMFELLVYNALSQLDVNLLSLLGCLTLILA